MGFPQKSLFQGTIFPPMTYLRISRYPEALFSPYDGCWGPPRGECSKGKKILGCTVFLLLKGCMAKPPKTSRTVFLSPVEQSLAVHIPKWWWLLSTDTFRRAAALEVGPPASSACYMHRQTPEGSAAARGLR